MDEKKIVSLVALIIVEMIGGLVVSSIPDPFSSETMKMLTSDPRFNQTYGTGESWLSLAEKANETAHMWRSIEQTFLFIILPSITGFVIIRVI